MNDVITYTCPNSNIGLAKLHWSEGMDEWLQPTVLTLKQLGHFLSKT